MLNRMQIVVLALVAACQIPDVTFTRTPEDAPTQDAPATPALRIMPLGDSITSGFRSSTDSSYRAVLWNLLAGDHVDYVGTQCSGMLPDSDNEGHSDWLISQIAGIPDSVLATYRPNVVTLHIGTSDISQNIDVATAPDRLSMLIDHILTAAPDATVLVATLVPSTDPDIEARIVAYNQQIPVIVAQRQDQGKHVRLVDMSAVTTADLFDMVHPNDNGYQKMASAFFTGIQQSLTAGWIKDPARPGPTCIDASAIWPSEPTCGWAGRGQLTTGTGMPASEVQFADFNGDGRDDYLVVDANGAVHAWINNGGDGAGGWIDGGQVTNGIGAPGSQVRFADLDGDGRADYLVVDANGAMRAWINKGGDGGGGWISRGQVANGVGAPGSQVRLADLDGDRKADYLVLADDGSIRAWINNNAASGGTWVARGQVAPSTGAPASQVQLANFDCDGRIDYLVVAANGAVHAWINKGGDGAGGWRDGGQVAGGTGVPGEVRFADIDGDGRADYLVVDANGAVTAWINKGGSH